MLTRKQLDKYADVLLWGLNTARNGKFKKGMWCWFSSIFRPLNWRRSFRENSSIWE